MHIRELISTPFVFEWDNGNRDKNWVKHGVANDEAEEIFDDADAMVVRDIHHSHHEERYALLGRTDADRMLFLIFTIREERIRVISARPPTERRWTTMKKPLILPEFKDEDEERAFWDQLDITEYFEPSDFKHVAFPNLRRTKKLVTLRLDPDLIDEVKQEASKRDMPYQALMRDYIRQGVRQQEMPETRSNGSVGNQG